MNRPPLRSTARGSATYEYFADAAVFHALMASGPECVRPSSFTTARLVKHRATSSPPRLSASKYAAMGSGRLGSVMLVSFLARRDQDDASAQISESPIIFAGYLAIET